MPIAASRNLLLSLPLISLSLALCQTARADDAPADADGYHHKTSPDIVVTAVLPHTQQDVLAGVSVVTGDQLSRQLRTTIGETLSRQPGVSSCGAITLTAPSSMVTLRPSPP